MSTSTKFPFMNAYGKIKDVFNAIITAGVPPRFTQDFLETKLGFKTSSLRPIIPLMKKLGLIASDGSPTELYKDFRLDSARGAAFLKAIKSTYSELFEANEYANKLNKKDLEDLFARLTGSEKGSSTLTAYVGTFQNLISFADFDAEDRSSKPFKKSNAEEGIEDNINLTPPAVRRSGSNSIGELPMGMNLSYTINLNLPETKDIEVFNAIFESLKEKLLK